MKFKTSDRDWYIKNPRRATLISAGLTIAIATFCGIIAESILQMFFEIGRLGIWATFATTGSVVAALVRLHAIAIATALGEWEVTVHDKKGRKKTRKIKQIASIEKTTESFKESFKSFIQLISIGLLTAISILITQEYPNINEQLPSWVKSYPISIAALASSTSIVMTNTKTVERLLGQGKAHLWVIRAGRYALIADAIASILVVLTGFIILYSRML